jgi:23S rRNA A2030 N6-methylase RlmJ
MAVSVESKLQSALETLADTVKTMPTASPKPNLLPLFAGIDELAQQLPRDTDPTLLHYLHKHSYEKARLYFQGRDAENQAGNCRHV